MKRLLYIASILFLGAVACTKEAELLENDNQASENSGLVAVTMKLAVPVELTASTRSTDANKRAEDPKIESIRVAVFGTSGYPQAYALATPVSKTTESGKTVYVDSEDYAKTNYRGPADIYYFKVLLPVYEAEAHVHIIANGDSSIPFDSVADEHSIMGHMESTDDVGAYWARVVLPDGILTQLDENGILQTDDEGNYIPSDETAALFEDVVLVRNFAEVSLNVAADAGISAVSWTLVNTPVSGSIAPVSMTGTRPKPGTTQPVFYAEYVDDYKNYIFYKKNAKMVLTDGEPVYDAVQTDSLTNLLKTYDGYMVSTALNTLPEDVEDEDIEWTDASKPLYTYERVDPKRTNPTFILMRARYGSETDYTYYRVDLMDEDVGGYYPIYRNYKYEIDVPYVGNHGASTPAEAIIRNSGGNMSMSAETKTLTDVSDGKSRLFVEFVEKTYTTSGQKSFWVYYVPDVTDVDSEGNAIVNNESINVTIKEMGDNPALANSSISSREEDGLKFYTVTLNGQNDSLDLESVLQVKATNGLTGTNRSTLYRDITLKVMKKMDMALSLEPPKVVEGTNINTILHIALTDTLQESMFPLEFYIEDSNRTLNPTGKDGAGNTIAVPVKIGPSIYNTADQHSYYYIRTVNWDEYKPMRNAWVTAHNAGQSVVGIIDFTTQFKTVKAASATTVYVDNEYFNRDSVKFENERFGLSTQTTSVNYRAQSVQVLLTADNDINWIANVDNGASLPEDDQQGQGSKTLTVNIPENTTDQQRTFTVTVTQGTRAAGEEISIDIVQNRGPVTPQPLSFGPDDYFTSNGNLITSSVTTADGYLTVSENSLSRSRNTTYLTAPNNSSVSFNSVAGIKITKIVINYVSGYGFTSAERNANNQRDRVNVTTSIGNPSFSDDGTVVTWEGNAETVTFTHVVGNRKDSRRISSISVWYE
ncbi:MAG: BACON domain-containing protein [Bacteroidales bacterium]|nr:BACON domain-containing protein [Bacteroidales bacterium]